VSAIDELLWNSKLHALSFGDAALHGQPAKGVAIVTCMDARIHVEALLRLRPGDAHVIRNAGGIVTADVLRSLALSQRLLGTREVGLLHHTDCGMMTFKEQDLASQMEREAGVKLPFKLGAFSDLEEDVRRSLTLVRSCRFLPHRDIVRGFVYEVTSGRLREVT
jgi:carbonic anhydrase